jgi:hypothetical protein
MSTIACMLWRRVDWPGHEAARLVQRKAGWELSGTAVFLYEAQACRLDYVVACDVAWRTVAAQVTGWVGQDAIDVAITVDTTGRWWMNERECPDVAGCLDVDLNFSPSTNLLPIRRLRLDVGHAADVSAAWLRFPSFALERFDQTYRRLGPAAYRYQSAGGFTADLDVDDAGFVTRYGDIWRSETGAS